ncbi:hypothetical protein TNCV_4997821 [Trichonephila clavipes]|nr:hypothetical protein TNCV_4997821 [Trichonephila clavipes]
MPIEEQENPQLGEIFREMSQRCQKEKSEIDWGSTSKTLVELYQQNILLTYEVRHTKNETSPRSHCIYRIIIIFKVSSLRHSHTSAFGATIAGKGSGMRFLGDSPFLSEPLH